MNVHEGEELKRYFRKDGRSIIFIAEKLGMSRQNVYHHLAKAKLDNTFVKLTNEQLGIDVLSIIHPEGSDTENLSMQPNARPIGAPIDRFTNKAGNDFIELSGGGYMMFTKWVQPKARLGYLSGWGDDEYIDELPNFAIFVKEMHKGRYMSFTAEGDSMDDGTHRSIKDGDVITGRRINRGLWKSKFHTNTFKEFVVHHRTLGIICKEIIDQDLEKGTITLRSYNTDKKAYPDFELNLDDIAEIYNVVQVTSPRG